MTLPTLTDCVTTWLNAQKDASFLDVVTYSFSTNNLNEFLNTFNLNPKNKEHYFRAFVHTSFANEHSSIISSSNERMEFLGDSILSLFISEKLYNEYPQLNEGQLSKLRSSLVNTDSLAELALYIGLDGLVLLGVGESKEEMSSSILADVFEAFIGAIFLDEGLEGVKTYLDKVFQAYKEKNGLPFINEERIKYFDPKSSLQEEVMSLYKELPEYQSREIDHSLYEVKVLIKGKLILETKSHSKKKAQKELAKEILKKELYKNL